MFLSLSFSLPPLSKNKYIKSVFSSSPFPQQVSHKNMKPNNTLYSLLHLPSEFFYSLLLNTGYNLFFKKHLFFSASMEALADCSSGISGLSEKKAPDH